ncbi:peptide MFS transporter [Sandarakinorhabdus sp.]|uniref:peptide MFS transporter n=1 Tax=Sandarakinorhabdus sp. TaxID=1916663 RepID=UPI00286E2974|nr:peptide MFS transporter [Sandarakinorhabdus sp.]
MTAGAHKGSDDLLGQPRGLAWLSGTQFWEAFSLYGMQALLTLYMVGQLLLPGHVENVAGLAATRGAIESVTGPLSTQAFAVQLFGLWAGLVRFTPVFGGWIGDRWLGRRRSIMLGCLLMTAGHFCMAFDRSFLLALFLLMLGTGFANSNLFSQLGSLYGPDDRRRDDGLQLYYFALNCGAFVAPIVCGWMGQELGWHQAFGLAGLGMLAGLLVYWLGGRHLPPDPPKVVAAVRVRLTAPERHAVRLLLVLMLVQAAFWIAQSQVWNVYNLWVRDHVDMNIAGFAVPIPWLQALDAIAPGLLLPVTLWLWRTQSRRASEPDAITKMAIGCRIFGAGMVWLAMATPLFGTARVPLLYAVCFHMLSNWGWVFFTPIAVGLYTRAAPPSLNAMMIGVNSMAVFVGSTISGRIGGLYEVWTPGRFWLLHAGIIAGGALLLLALRPAVRRMLAAG